MAVVGHDRRPANFGENVDCRVQCHSTDNIRRASLLPVGRVVPDDVVEFDEVYRAAACQEGVTLREGGAGPMSTPAPKGAYILWPLQTTKSALSGSGR